MAGKSLGWLIGGMGVGAGLSYLLDPGQGRRRRAAVRDATTHLLRQERDVLDKGARDLRHRATGLLEKARSRGAGPVDDAVLNQRVRAVLGRCASHPSAIEVCADGGRVTLSGQILTHEAGRTLRRVRRVRGVRAVDDRLERHDRPGRISALQGPGRVPRPVYQREVWPPSLRLLALGSGATLGAYGLAHGGILGKACALAGGALLVRGTTNLPIRRLTGVGAGPRAVDVQKSIHIAAAVEDVYALWTHFENFPRFMEHVDQVSVLEQDPDRSRWTVQGPGKMDVSFEVEVTQRVPNQVIAWRTLPDQIVEHAGVVHFQPEAAGTRLHLRLCYNPPGGALGHAILRMLGSDFKSRLDQDLVRVKALLEDGQTRAHGQRIRIEEVKAR